MTTLKDRLHFLKCYAKDIRHIGAVTPSSRQLGRTMASAAGAGSKVIVELGGGTGSITVELLKRLAPDGALLTFETEKSLCARLQQIASDQLYVINDCATTMRQHLQKENMRAADYIVSGLPLTCFPAKLRDAVLEECVANLSPDGAFIMFQYMLPWSYPWFRTQHLSKYFNDIKAHRVFWNLPPAIVYECRNHSA